MGGHSKRRSYEGEGRKPRARKKTKEDRLADALEMAAEIEALTASTITGSASLADELALEHDREVEEMENMDTVATDGSESSDSEEEEGEEENGGDETTETLSMDGANSARSSAMSVMSTSRSVRQSSSDVAPSTPKSARATPGVPSATKAAAALAAAAEVAAVAAISTPGKGAAKAIGVATQLQLALEAVEGVTGTSGEATKASDGALVAPPPPLLAKMFTNKAGKLVKKSANFSPVIFPSAFQGKSGSAFFEYAPGCSLEYTRESRTKEKLGKPESKTLPLTFKISDRTWEYNCIINSFLRAGFKRTEGNEWNAFWGNHLRSKALQKLNKFQKVNHFPGSWGLGRKDKLWRNISRMQRLHGVHNFNFHSKTFLLPSEKDLVIRERTENPKGLWIRKPYNRSEGRGIKVVKAENIKVGRRHWLIQKYVNHPYLINNRKFDLRIYVCVTSFDPLRIYVFEDGLVRFCTHDYTQKSLGNRYCHLTNYSVNKKNEAFQRNENPEEDGVGSKWSIAALNKYFRDTGVDVDKVWSKIHDLIIKTIISVEPTVATLQNRFIKHRNTCYELFGFDVLLDSSLKPWLMEVNISCSLSSGSPLDKKIKTTLMADIFNLVGITPYDRKSEKAANEKEKMSRILGLNKKGTTSRAQQGTSKTLTQEELTVLMETADEARRCGHFKRIFPCENMEDYMQFFEFPRHGNQLVHYWMKAGGTIDIINEWVLQSKAGGGEGAGTRAEFERHRSRARSASTYRGHSVDKKKEKEKEKEKEAGSSTQRLSGSLTARPSSVGPNHTAAARPMEKAQTSIQVEITRPKSSASTINYYMAMDAGASKPNGGEKHHPVRPKTSAGRIGTVGGVMRSYYAAPTTSSQQKMQNITSASSLSSRVRDEIERNNSGDAPSSSARLHQPQYHLSEGSTGQEVAQEAEVQPQAPADVDHEVVGPYGRALIARALASRDNEPDSQSAQAGARPLVENLSILSAKDKSKMTVLRAASIVEAVTHAQDQERGGDGDEHFTSVGMKAVDKNNFGAPRSGPSLSISARDHYSASGGDAGARTGFGRVRTQSRPRSASVHRMWSTGKNPSHNASSRGSGSGDVHVQANRTYTGGATGMNTSLNANFRPGDSGAIGLGRTGSALSRPQSAAARGNTYTSSVLRGVSYVNLASQPSRRGGPVGLARSQSSTTNMNPANGGKPALHGRHHSMGARTTGAPPPLPNQDSNVLRSTTG